MHIFTTISSLRQYLSSQRQQNKSIGFVPTMGALHAGHIALIGQSNAETDLTVCSIFVNPTQFNNPEDLEKYPRTPEADQQMLQEGGCNVLFMPDVTEMYPHPTSLQFNFGSLESVLEGQFRPGHFNGVGLVVSKLLHMVQPDKAFFGQKDLQQCLVIRRLIQDLSFSTTLVICPTVREADGLAMSSRNRRLTAAQRQVAPLLYQALVKAQTLLTKGGTITQAKEMIVEHLSQSTDIQIEYAEVVDIEQMQTLVTETATPPYAICLAAYLGQIRLIDNLFLT